MADPVTPATIRELADLVRLQGDNLNDLEHDLYERGELKAAGLAGLGRDAAWAAYDVLKESGW